MNIFRKPTVEETVKEAKREASRAQRSVGRDGAQLKREEQMLLAKIKEASKRGNEGELKILAKQVVQLRKQQERLAGMGAQLNTVKNQATIMKASNTMATVMANTGKAMKKMNQTANGDKLHANMRAYQEEMDKAGLNEEMMDDILGDAFDDDIEEETDELVRQTLEEIGVDATKALGPAPTHNVETADEELEAETERLMQELLGKKTLA